MADGRHFEKKTVKSLYLCNRLTDFEDVVSCSTSGKVDCVEVGNLITHDMDEDLSSVFSFTQKDDPKGLAKASDCTVSCNSSCVDGDLLITRRDDVKKTSSIYDCCEVDPAECSTFSITQ